MVLLLRRWQGGTGQRHAEFSYGHTSVQHGLLEPALRSVGRRGFRLLGRRHRLHVQRINWNAADAMQANNDYASSVSYQRLDGGYGLLFDAMAAKVTELASKYPGS